MKNKNETLTEQHILFPLSDFKIVVADGNMRAVEKAFHEEIEIKYFYQGTSTLMIDGDMIVAKPGDITVVNPFEVHSSVNIGYEDGKYISIILNLDFLKELNPNGLDLRRALITKGQKFCNHIINDKRLQTIALRVFEEVTGQKENYRLVVYSLVTEFFVLLFRGYVNGEKSAENSKAYTKRAELISPALAKIFKDYAKKITVEELSELCSVTKYHFCRLFKEETGLTAIQYINSYRISIAEAMLKTTDSNIEDVAYACGFEDVSYFYRCYKKTKGVSPKKTRNN